MAQKEGLRRRVKRLMRQVSEGEMWYTEEQRRKADAARKALRRKRLALEKAQEAAKKETDWASKYNIATRKMIKRLRDGGLPDDAVRRLVEGDPRKLKPTPSEHWSY
ncbi:MAG: hypothetical protein ACTSQY_02710 [Candidatus Odinarchaeia archaeon]